MRSEKGEYITDIPLREEMYQGQTPRVIDSCYENIDLHGSDILVRPEMLSICKADQRYFFGMRYADDILSC